MKLQTSKKAIRNGFSTVISIGYCSAEYLLYYKNPIAYSAGIYGWSCDYYQIGAKCICTGYSPFGTRPNYDLIRDLERKASEIVHNYDFSYDEKVQKVDLLLNELLNSIN